LASILPRRPHLQSGNPVEGFESKEEGGREEAKEEEEVEVMKKVKPSKARRGRGMH
jgi:hypothetical protein